MKTALIAGASGLVGTEVLKLLVASNRYDKVKAIVRSELDLKHEKVEQIQLDFTKLENSGHDLAADDVFCCLGTTMAKAKSQERFRLVDYHYPVSLAHVAKAFGAKQFLMVSALGANKNASVFYNRVKGEAEESISTIRLNSIHFFRPSLLLGPRRESRSAEDAAKVFYKIFGFLIPDKYKAIDAKQVAWSMLRFAELEEKGIFFHESKEMLHLK